jgi:GGDEF domain-containing protein
MVFSHDGLHDSLTALAAPPYFYESLKREFSIASRNKTSISAINMRLTSFLPVFEHGIVTFSHIARKEFRLEDHLSRMSHSVFIALIQTDEEIAIQIIQRLISRWTLEGTPDVNIMFAICQRKDDESPLDFLSRLDETKLQSFEF